MTLSNARNRIRKADKLINFAKRKNLPVKNFKLIEFNKIYEGLSMEDQDKFTNWYNKKYSV